jgi:hypothetical protein
MSRRASDSAGSVLSFTFLDVLMCTMGSLLLLLVVFGVIAKKVTREKRPGEQAKITMEALAAETPGGAMAKPPEATTAEADGETPDPAALARQLDQLRSEQAKLEAKRAEVAQRRREQQEVISHLEDHERRLENDLGTLYVTLQALKAAEQEHSTDREQAAAEAERLAELIRDTEAQLDDMRKNGDGKKSFAIVPYKGANGTFRRPIFVECTDDAVTIQPEGIRLTVEDFDGPLRSGNPLAAAIRAAHEELNARAAAAGQAKMPDPYPLLIVRPDGAGAYAAAVDAIRSWDADYGYEFVEADWKLKYPESDPRLGEVMGRAVDQARERQALLARVAPMQYGSRLSTGVGAGAGGGAGEGGFDALAGGGRGRIGAHSGEGSLDGPAGGNALRGGDRYGGAGGNFSDEFAFASTGGVAVGTASTAGVAGSDAAGASGGGVGGEQNSGSGETGGTSATVPAAGQETQLGSRYGGGTGGAAGGSPGSAQGTADQYATTGGATGASGAASRAAGDAGGAGAPGGAAGGSSASGASASAAGASSAMASTGGTASEGASAAAGSAASAATATNMGSGAPPVNLNARRESAADTRGANWADAEATRRASAIARPIKVQVSAEQIAVLDSDNGASPAAATVVPFKQPVNAVLDQLAAAVADRKADWGLAGDNMYWRPTLVLYVTPGAERQAARLTELLDNSGIDVRLPQTAARPAAGGALGAPR